MQAVGVSDKAISKWDNGNGFPDVSNMLDLCRNLHISVNELLAGERIATEEYSLKAEDNHCNKKKIQACRIKAHQKPDKGKICSMKEQQLQSTRYNNNNYHETCMDADIVLVNMYVMKIPTGKKHKCSQRKRQKQMHDFLLYKMVAILFLHKTCKRTV